MIVVNEESFIQGNTVLQPEYRPYKDNKDYKEKNKKNLKRNRNTKKRINSKAKIIGNTILAFIIGLVLIGRYCVIYNMQMELNLTKHNINEINKENENLKVELVKYNNLQYIEETATSKLQMLPPDKGAAVYTNLDKENIKITEKKVQDKVEKQNIWSRLTKVLF